MVLCASLVAPGAAAWVGSTACAGCHDQEHAAWRGSHHDLAMQKPTPDTVLGNFDNATFIYNGITTRFHTRQGRYYVDTDGESGALETFEVAYVFGVYPLQQYLLPLSRGRLQALTIAWDARPAAQGGQRWYHLYPDEAIAHDDPLHWTGPYLNWNTRCAECHSTDVQKNYDAASRSYATTFEEIDVGCESCHGPGDTHVARARAGKLDAGSGFPTALAQRGRWHLPPDSSVARRSEPLADNAQIDNCGRCHSRRGTLGDYHYGANLLDTHRLSLPRSPLYHPDGQILDEVYVYGSFVQSKMHQAGVVCSNCHEPHSLALRAPGNGVCTQCHVSDKYDTPQHHHHASSSAGALCANCHMPEQTYMGVDPRRDHSLRVPRPDLSLVMGTPNACNQCHDTKSTDWALDALRSWGVTFRDTHHHRGRLFARLEQGDTSVVPSLAALANATDEPPIWRATALEALGETGGREALQSATALVYDDNPLLRLSAVRSLEFLPLDQRYRVLSPLIDDPVTAVRMAVASSLAGVPLAQLPAEQNRALRALFDEYLAVQQSHADMPGVQLQLGLFHAAAQDVGAAEAAYREALRMNNQLVPAYLNLADLMRATGRDPDARTLLAQAQEALPDNGDILHVMGLLETRAGNKDKALDYLARAAALETGGTRHRFVYAVALHDLGQPEAAVKQLRQLLRATPGDPQVLGALVNYLRGMGRVEEAQRYAERLRSPAPGQRQVPPTR
jgi:tetratricopeptide (TPR) repeat protein